MSETIEVDVKDEVLMKALKLAPKQLMRNLPAAGLEALKEVLDSPGIRNYPPATDANTPPSPYYIRGRGTQYATKNAGNSERYGSSWGEFSLGYGKVRGSAYASYAEYVGGEKQPRHMADKGWRKVKDVAREKLHKLNEIYNKWIKMSLRQAGF